ncbi:MAG: sulfite exporter TauE/SafE family protein [Oculatellaceae cyanobacterium Prado106]|jgi:ABC-type nickel/cobalt efflux system permease component RcnA|nr:sulfite exporter TauE/SafE family protein [Oculatellaceae cyanobacterium Prado106]
MKLKRFIPGILSCLGAIAISWFWATPGLAHWADMAAAEVEVKASEVQMLLTFPTGLVAFADGDRNQQLSISEIEAHHAALTTFLDGKIRLTNDADQAGKMTLRAIDPATLNPATLPSIKIAPSTHSTVQLNYTWLEPIQGLKMQYGLFLPGISTAHCLATILQAGQLRTFLFTPTQSTLTLGSEGTDGLLTGGLVLAVATAFLWGAMHSLSPGHGKTLVGAYLIGERATPKHALILAATTTLTHTLGVYALGLVALFATQYLLPEQISPWLSLGSGVMVIAIGINLFRDRLQNSTHSHSHSNSHSHPHSHPHSRSHPHSHSHSHTHSHSNYPSSHTPHPTLQHSPHSEEALEHQTHDSHPHSHAYTPHAPSLRHLIPLGISGGLSPCPAALVLLLGAIAVQKTGLGLVLVFAFSLGLAVVLTGLGLLLVYAKQFFQRLNAQRSTSKSFQRLRPWMSQLPALSAIAIACIGTGVATQALIQVLASGGN